VSTLGNIIGNTIYNGGSASPIGSSDFADEVLALGPKHYYRLGDSASPLVDSGSGLKDMTVTGAALYDQTAACPTSDDGAYNPDGTGQASTVVWANSYAFPISTHAWVNIPTTTGVTNAHPIYQSAFHPSFYYGFWWQVNKNGAVVFHFGDGGVGGPDSRQSNTSVNLVPLDVPAFVAITATAVGAVKMYINGVESTITTSGTATTVNWGNGGTPSIIGYHATDISDGVIDEVASYSGVELSQAQITSLYNTGAA